MGSSGKAYGEKFGPTYRKLTKKELEARKPVEQAAPVETVNAVRYEVWYTKGRLEDSHMAALRGEGVAVTMESLADTHACVAYLADNGATLAEIFSMMQGEVWSPNGEARDIIGATETWHTSMSQGDVVVDRLLNVAWEVGQGFGWHLILPAKVKELLLCE